MASAPDSLQRLIEEFSKLPGVGRKSAQRLSLYILKQPVGEVRWMVTELLDL